MDAPQNPANPYPADNYPRNLNGDLANGCLPRLFEPTIPDAEEHGHRRTEAYSNHCAPRVKLQFPCCTHGLMLDPPIITSDRAPTHLLRVLAMGYLIYQALMVLLQVPLGEWNTARTHDIPLSTVLFWSFSLCALLSFLIVLRVPNAWSRMAHMELTPYETELMGNAMLYAVCGWSAVVMLVRYRIGFYSDDGYYMMLPHTIHACLLIVWCKGYIRCMQLLEQSYQMSDKANQMEFHWVQEDKRLALNRGLRVVRLRMAGRNENE